MITIIDIGMGNIGSVTRALKFLHIEHEVHAESAAIRSARRLIFPGVGSFGEASRCLTETGIGDAIHANVTANRTPILGICLGMQLLSNSGDEATAGASSAGLGLVKGHVGVIHTTDPSLHIPHMGWNDVQHNSMAMFKDVPEDSCFYFVHSYAMQLEEDIEYATTDYGGNIVAAIAHDHVWGVQFHPEKSQEVGLQVLRNFVNLSC